MFYTISYQNPLQHFLTIELLLKNVMSAQVRLQLPSWRPGRYELQHFAKNIRQFEAFTSNGSALKWQKISKDCWEIDTKNEEEVHVRYEYYAFQMDAGNSWLDEEQVYINFINCMMYVEGRLQDAIEVTLTVPATYQIACGLPKISSNKLLAENYFQLVDSPLIASPCLQHSTYSVDNKLFHLWFQSRRSLDLTVLTQQFKDFTEAHMAVFDNFPCEDYHFLFQILPYTHYHGVEHFNSTVITLGPHTDWESGRFQTNLLGISSHELFHSWNVIRIKPKELSPLNFTKENYFSTGWVMEGITTYYGDLLLARSGVIDLEGFFQEINQWMGRHFDNFGRHQYSLAQSSFDLWLDGYVAGIPGRKVSIYIKGALVALMLDLEIRRITHDTQSLDVLMRRLWAEFGATQIGYTAEDVKEIVSTIAGEDLSEFFELFVDGTEPLEHRLGGLISWVGCRLEVTSNPLTLERCFGFRLAEQSGKWKVVSIAPNSPAESGLSILDEITEINGQATSLELQRQHLETSIQLTINRNYQTKVVTLPQSGQWYFPCYKIKIKEAITQEERVRLTHWLGKAKGPLHD
jgi:predicted metalloprotease with PDZ domain